MELLLELLLPCEGPAAPVAATVPVMSVLGAAPESDGGSSRYSLEESLGAALRPWRPSCCPGTAAAVSACRPRRQADLSFAAVPYGQL